MSETLTFLGLLGGYLFVIVLPLLALYLVYLIVTKAFRDMGFSSWEAIVIVFVSFFLGAGLLDSYVGFPFSNIPLFTYQTYWVVGMNAGGAVVPLLLSVYLGIKNKLHFFKIVIGIGIVAVMTFFVTHPDPEKGIVSSFPFWLLPVLLASLTSVVLYWKEKRKAAPLAYIIGTLGVLLGADCFHLISLLNTPIQTTREAVIGGASVFDMVFITGLLAVFLDGLFIVQQKRNKKKNEQE